MSDVDVYQKFIYRYYEMIRETKVALVQDLLELHSMHQSCKFRIDEEDSGWNGVYNIHRDHQVFPAVVIGGRSRYTSSEELYVEVSIPSEEQKLAESIHLCIIKNKFWVHALHLEAEILKTQELLDDAKVLDNEHRRIIRKLHSSVKVNHAQS